MSTQEVVRRFALAYTLALAAIVGGFAAFGTYPSSIGMMLAFGAAALWSVYPVRRALAPPIPSADATAVVILVSLLGAAAMGAYMGYIFYTSTREGLWRALPFAYLTSVAIQALVAYFLVDRSVDRLGRPRAGSGGQQYADVRGAVERLERGRERE